MLALSSVLSSDLALIVRANGAIYSIPWAAVHFEHSIRLNMHFRHG